MAETKLIGQLYDHRIRGILNTVPSSGSVLLQAKTAYPSHDEQVIMPDDDYQGLSLVKVIATPRVPMAETSFSEGSIGVTIMAHDGNISADVVGLSELSHFLPNYEVVAVDGATYGFALNDDGYYESQNKGIKESYAVCKVTFTTEAPGYIQLACINYAEAGSDYGLISLPDNMLNLNYYVDSEAYINFANMNSADVQFVQIPVPSAGEHFLCVKYRKNSSTNSNNDSLQFKLV